MVDQNFLIKEINIIKDINIIDGPQQKKQSE